MIANLVSGNFEATVFIASAIRKPTPIDEVVLLLRERGQVRHVVRVRLGDEHARLDPELGLGALQALVRELVERAVVEAADVGDQTDLDLLGGGGARCGCWWSRRRVRLSSLPQAVTTAAGRHQKQQTR